MYIYIGCMYIFVYMYIYIYFLNIKFIFMLNVIYLESKLIQHSASLSLVQV